MVCSVLSRAQNLVLYDRYSQGEINIVVFLGYGPDTTQKEMFDGTVKGLVRDVLEGQNSLVFTYGITNAGKTFTFLGLYI